MYDKYTNKNNIWETQHYGFPVAKSSTTDPDLERAVKIDQTIKDEETARINEDIKINARIDKEIEDRIAEVENEASLRASADDALEKKDAAQDKIITQINEKIDSKSDVFKITIAILTQPTSGATKSIRVFYNEKIAFLELSNIFISNTKEDFVGDIKAAINGYTSLYDVQTNALARVETGATCYACPLLITGSTIRISLTGLPTGRYYVSGILCVPLKAI